MPAAASQPGGDDSDCSGPCAPALEAQAGARPGTLAPAPPARACPAMRLALALPVGPTPASLPPPAARQGAERGAGPLPPHDFPSRPVLRLQGWRCGANRPRAPGVCWTITRWEGGSRQDGREGRVVGWGARLLAGEGSMARASETEMESQGAAGPDGPGQAGARRGWRT